MRLILATALLVAVVSASTLHLTPTTTTRLYIVNPTNIRREYQTQDSKGFYSYGYSGDSSAKAEYTARDGSSRGFYSYVDSDGQLQTVKYEAGRKQGFKATATNLPKAPVDNRKAPKPVKDTPEVELARQEHLEAIREAELREALAENERARALAEELEQQQSLAAQLAQQRQQATAAAEAQEQAAAAAAAAQTAEQSTADETAAILARARAELRAALELQSSRERGSDGDERTSAETEAADDERDASEERNADAHDDVDNESEERVRLAIETKMRQSAAKDSKQRNNERDDARMTTYTIRTSSNNNNNIEDNTAQLSLDQLRTIYTLSDDSSNSYLKLADIADRKSLTLLDATTTQTNLDDRTIAELQVPVNAYYTLLTPTTKYSVATPTVLTTLPRVESIRLGGNRLPISLSHSILTQRLNDKRN